MEKKFAPQFACGVERRGLLEGAVVTELRSRALVGENPWARLRPWQVLLTWIERLQEQFSL